ncbi:hypothetical protein COCVIDRAFT_11528 [Bipolaris victoriae FI3]|uniref:Serine carboxypeptidase n=1 Tax=Bipolaris victoriae (strain FI3) TaxID=930091 RepID=W7F3G7_BIPV3|nr:hypothetical protein COCVIDRAFT_11528 [Bipolaris victoriae FI3]
MHAMLYLLLSLASASLAIRARDPLHITSRHSGKPDPQGQIQIAKREAPPGTEDNPAIGYFEQPIDHHNPSLGTFKMRYSWSNEFWKGPGSPIVLWLPGETDASPFYLWYGNYSSTEFYFSQGQLASNLGAAYVVLENRYYGESSPYPELTTANLKYLTFDQVMRDTVNFAKNVKLPFAANSTASDVPWVLAGGSYSGVITVDIATKLPGTFWAYWATSAAVHSELEYWRQSDSFLKAGPKNCTKDVAQVIDYIDSVLLNGSQKEIDVLKANFGLQNLTHNEDFVNTLSGDPELWLNVQFDINAAPDGVWNPATRNYTHSKLPGIEGVGVEKALKNWGNWVKNYRLPGMCKDGFGKHYPGLYSENSTYCEDSYDPNNPFYTDISVGNPWNRQYLWFECNEAIGGWTAGAPKGTPSLISRLLDVKYGYHMCEMLFPKGPNGETYGLRTVDQFNEYWGGWNIGNTTRLLIANGEYDYWRPTTFASEVRPGGPLQSTAQLPAYLVPGGYHCSDSLYYRNARRNEPVRMVIHEILAQLEAWVKEWPGKKGSSS